MKKTLFLLLAALVVWICLPVLRIRGPDRFSSDRLVVDFAGHFPADEDNEISRMILSSLQNNGALSFDYLGHGSQAIAFASQDGKLVLKLLLSKELQGPKKGGVRSLLRIIPSLRMKWDEERRTARAKKLSQALNAYALSLRHLKEDTGLISLHVHPTERLFPPCVVRDRQGQVHAIDLDRVVFILQRRVELLTDRFANIQSGEQYERSTKAMRELFERHIRKGISDFNPRFKIANYGFVGDQAIILDTGRISYSQATKERPEPELERMNGFFSLWLSNSATITPCAINSAQ